MSNAKPIVLVHYNIETNEGRVTQFWKALENRLPDYHVLVVVDLDVEYFRLEVFYEKDFTEVKYEELKEIIIKTKNEVQHS